MELNMKMVYAKLFFKNWIPQSLHLISKGKLSKSLEDLK